MWARRALGDFWGFQTAWWWSLSIFVDSSVYIVLAVGYLQNWLEFSQLWFYVICWAIIAVFALMNIIGVKLIALSSTLFSIIILAPFFVLIVVGLAKWNFNPLTPGHGARRSRSSAPAACSPSASPSASGCTRATSRCPRSRGRSATRSG